MTSVASDQSSLVDYRVFERLQKDSEDIDLALDQFMRDRESALNVQLRSKQEYEAEMRRLDEGDLNMDYEKAMRATPAVDHNLMRHLNAHMPGEGGGEDDYGEGGFEGEDEEYANFERYNSAPQFSVYAEAKKVMPNFDEKAALREQIFAFLDEARLQELQLDLKYSELQEQIEATANGSNKLNNTEGDSTELLGSVSVATPATFVGPMGSSYVSNSMDPDNINYGFKILPEELKAEAIQDRLCDLQLRNSDGLKALFADYQVNPFGKAWGNDPDYIALSNKLRDMMVSGQKISAAVLLGDMGGRRRSVSGSASSATTAAGGSGGGGNKKTKKKKGKKGKKATANA